MVKAVSRSTIGRRRSIVDRVEVEVLDGLDPEFEGDSIGRVLVENGRAAHEGLLMVASGHVRIAHAGAQGRAVQVLDADLDLLERDLDARQDRVDGGGEGLEAEQVARRRFGLVGGGGGVGRARRRRRGVQVGELLGAEALLGDVHACVHDRVDEHAREHRARVARVQVARFVVVLFVQLILLITEFIVNFYFKLQIILKPLVYVSLSIPSYSKSSIFWSLISTRAIYFGTLVSFKRAWIVLFINIRLNFLNFFLRSLTGFKVKQFR